MGTADLVEAFNSGAGSTQQAKCTAARLRYVADNQQVVEFDIPGRQTVVSEPQAGTADILGVARALGALEAAK